MCTRPLLAWKVYSAATKSHSRMVFRDPCDGTEPQTVGCGQCLKCRIRYQHDWKVRLMHENKLHRASSFLTLTYNDEHMPEGRTLVPRDLQLFMKRLRWEISTSVRFFACGEYGDLLGRPHLHVIVFGFDFSDRWQWKQSKSGHPLYRSPLLEKCWSVAGRPIGNCDFGSVTPESCGYVAGYGIKKITGAKAKEHYEWRDPDGVVYDRHPEFVRMSNRPGIGRGFLNKFEQEMFDNDSVIVNGRERSLPRYYEAKFREASFENADRLEELKRRREARALLRPAEERTPERLAAIEAYEAAMLKRFSRDYE